MSNANEQIENSTLVVVVKLNILDSEGFYLGDYIVGEGQEPDNWTSDLVGNGYYRAQYQGGTRNSVSGEWAGGHWVETSGPSHESLVDAAATTKAALMAEATVVIAPLQDAVDLDEATDEEIALLKEWKKYRVTLNRIDPETAPDIVWPVKPRLLNRAAADAE